LAPHTDPFLTLTQYSEVVRLVPPRDPVFTNLSTLKWYVVVPARDPESAITHYSEVVRVGTSS